METVINIISDSSHSTVSSLDSLTIPIPGSVNEPNSSTHQSFSSVEIDYEVSSGSEEEQSNNKENKIHISKTIGVANKRASSSLSISRLGIKGHNKLPALKGPVGTTDGNVYTAKHPRPVTASLIEGRTELES